MIPLLGCATVPPLDLCRGGAHNRSFYRFNEFSNGNVVPVNFPSSPAILSISTFVRVARVHAALPIERGLMHDRVHALATVVHVARAQNGTGNRGEAREGENTRGGGRSKVEFAVKGMAKQG